MTSVTGRRRRHAARRRTYQNFVAVWQQVDSTDPAIAAMNRMPKYLVSRTLTDPTWNNTIRLGPTSSARWIAFDLAETARS